MRSVDLEQLLTIAGDEAIELGETLHNLSRLISGHHELRMFLDNPLVSPDSQKGAIAALFPGALPLFYRVVGLLVDHQLGNQLSSIAAEFSQLAARRFGLVYAQVESAFELTDGEQAKIKEFLGGQVRLRLSLRPDLLGGVRVKTSDGRFFEDSFRGRLEQLKEVMAGG
ncbi:MAG: ATP synthase F1 subunit delta [Candidatus Margulisiibacteriota bacterium]